MSDVVSLSEFFKRFPDEKAARDFIEKRFWPDGAYCPHCGNLQISICNWKNAAMPYRCKNCRRYFSIRIGTIFNESRLSLQKWLLAMFILANSKKGVSFVYLAEQLGCTQKTAWFLVHRIRETWETDGK